MSETLSRNSDFLNAVSNVAPSAMSFVETLLSSHQIQESEIEVCETNFIYTNSDTEKAKTFSLTDQGIREFYSHVTTPMHHF